MVRSLSCHLEGHHSRRSTISNSLEAPAHCPNFVPTSVEREWYDKPKKFVKHYFNNDPWLVDNIMDKANFSLDSKVIPVRVRYKNEEIYHTSLAHM